jgi:hypothetical protein
MVQGGVRRLGIGRSALPLLVALLILLSAAAGSARASVYFGATISGETYGQTGFAPLNQSAWSLFERHAGKKVAILGQNQTWCAFDSAEMTATSSRGAIPLVNMGLNGTLAEVAAGKQDAAIKQWAQAAKAYGHPFLFAPWWEMNGTWYPWGRSPDFVAAWRRFHDLVAAQGATNVTWAWVPNSIWAEDPESNPAPYYPGDAYVDWVGFDSYNWGLSPIQPAHWTTPNQTFNPTLKIVKELAPAKPILIAETGSSELGGNKTDWIRETFGTYLPHHPEVKGFVWFNWNFPQNGARADWPIESSAPAQQEFRRQLQSGLYVGGPTGLPALTKVPAPGPGPADAAAAEDLSPPGEIAGGPRVAGAPDGSATTVWSARQGGKLVVYARRIAPDGSRGPILPLSDPARDALDPQVAVGADGTATVAWVASDGTSMVVQTRRIDPAGAPAATTLTLSASGRDATGPRIALAPDGEATVVWNRFSGSDFLVEERRVAPDGSLIPASKANVLSAPGGDAVEPEVASAESGAAVVAWSRSEEADPAAAIEARSIDAAGAPSGAARRLSEEAGRGVEPRVAIGPGGTATIVWTESQGGPWRIEEQRLSAAGAPLGEAQALSAATGDAVEPALAAAPDGRLVAAWERFDGTSFVVQARRIAASGEVASSALNLSAAGQDAAGPALDVSADGNATVLWSRFDGSAFVVQAETLKADGTAGGVESISAAGRRAGAPDVAWTGQDGLVLAWRRFGGAGDVIQGKLIPPPPRPPSPPPAPESVASSRSTQAPPSGGSPSASGKGTAPSAGVFRIEKVVLNRKRGTATLMVTVPGSGRLALKGAAPRGFAVRGAGMFALPVVPRPAQRRLLERRGRLPLQVTVSFQPAGGGVLSQKLKVQLRKLSSAG